MIIPESESRKTHLLVRVDGGYVLDLGSPGQAANVLPSMRRFGFVGERWA